MLIILAIGLVLIPACAILWPFVIGAHEGEFDESNPGADLMRRWDSAVAGLQAAELDHAIGNLSDADYNSLRYELMSEAGVVLKTMEIGDRKETELFEAVNRELEKVRERIIGHSGAQ